MKKEIVVFWRGQMRTLAGGLGAPSLGDIWKAREGGSMCLWDAALGKDCCAVSSHCHCNIVKNIITERTK